MAQRTKRARRGKVELVKGKGGVHFRLKAGNGEIVATGETHADRSKAKRAWAAVKRLAAGAQIVSPDGQVGGISIGLALTVLVGMVGIGGVSLAVSFSALVPRLSGLDPTLFALISVALVVIAIAALSVPAQRELPPNVHPISTHARSTSSAAEKDRVPTPALVRRPFDEPAANRRLRGVSSMERRARGWLPLPVFAFEPLSSNLVALVGWLIALWVVMFAFVAVWIVWSYQGPALLRRLDAWRRRASQRLQTLGAVVGDALFPSATWVDPLLVVGAGAPLFITEVYPFRRPSLSGAASNKPTAPDAGAVFGRQSTARPHTEPPVTPSTTDAPPAAAVESSVPSNEYGVPAALWVHVERIAQALYDAAVVSVHGAEAALHEGTFAELAPAVRRRLLQDATVIVRELDSYRFSAAVLAAQRVAGSNFDKGLQAYHAHLLAPPAPAVRRSR